MIPFRVAHHQTSYDAHFQLRTVHRFSQVIQPCLANQFARRRSFTVVSMHA